uniref:Uncharacterized protein n=1 Tax=Opuntia streptacantha TaxID=393608 RepID=A0A7C9EM11_OPUST
MTTTATSTSLPTTYTHLIQSASTSTATSSAATTLHHPPPLLTAAMESRSVLSLADPTPSTTDDLDPQRRPFCVVFTFLWYVFLAVLCLIASGGGAMQSQRRKREKVT